MADKFTYYPMEVDRFDESDRVRSMTLNEVGLYILCLNRSWKYGSLADDVEQVSLDIRRRVSDVEPAWPAVRACYVPMPRKPGRLINKTQEEKRLKVSEKTTKSKAAATLRWEKERSAKAHADASTDAYAHASADGPADAPTDADADAMPRAFNLISISPPSSKFFSPNAERVLKAYPREVDDEDMRNFLSFILNPEDEALFFKNLPLHAAMWNRGFEVKLETFLRKGTWKVTPKREGLVGKRGGIGDTLAWIDSFEVKS